MPAGLTFNVYGHDVSATKALKGVGDHADKTAKGIGGSFKKAGALIAGAFAITKVKDFFADSIAEAREAQKVGAQTAAVLKSTGGAANVTAGQIGDLATAISKKAGIDDEAIQSGENLLLTFTNIKNEAGKGNDIFNQTSGIMADLSVAMGQSMTTSAVQLGKALNDPIAGVSKLTKVGVSFTLEQKDQIAAMQKAGDTAGAQKIILAELTREFGGSAAAQATAGQKMSVAWGNIKEQVGTALLPVLDSLENTLTNKILPAMSGTVTWLQKNWHWLKYVATAVVGLFAAWKTYTAIKSGVQAISGAVTTLKTDFAALKAKGASSLSALKGSAGAVTVGMAGLAVGVGLVAYAIHQNSQRTAELKQLTAEYLGVLQQTKGAIDDQVKSVLTQKLAQDGVYDAARKYGIGLDTVTQAALGNKDAQQLLFQKTHGNIDAFNAVTSKVLQNGAAINTASQQYKDAATQQGKLAGATGKNTAAQAGQTTALDKTKSAMDQQKTAADKLLASIKKLSGDKINAAQAELQFRDGLAQATQQVKDNGASLSANTVKGRSNREWLLSQLSSLQDVASAQLDAGQKTGVVTQKLHDNERALRIAADAAGLNSDQVKTLIARYGRMPKAVTTKVTAVGLGAAIDQLDTLRGQLKRLAKADIYIGSSVNADGQIAIKGGGRYAQGTGWAAGGMSTVGELGRERVRLPVGARVDSATMTQSAARMGGGAAGLTVNVSVNGALATTTDIQDAVVTALTYAARRGVQLPILKVIR